MEDALDEWIVLYVVCLSQPLKYLQKFTTADFELLIFPSLWIEVSCIILLSWSLMVPDLSQLQLLSDAHPHNSKH